MSADAARAFDRLVAAADTAMIGVVTEAGGEVGGCLVGFHCQCSIEPRRYAVWLSKANHTCRLAERAEYLSVHWLARHQVGVAERLGTVSADVDPAKMRHVPVTRDPDTGAPVLDEVHDRFVGRVVHRHDDGDHVCFVVEPVSAVAPAQSSRLRLSQVAHLEAGHPADPDEPARDNR